MATSFSNLNEAKVDAAVIDAARTALPYIKLFSHVVQAEPAVQNSVIKVPLATDPTVADKTPGAYVTDTGGLTGVSVTLNAFKSAHWVATEGSIGADVFESWWLSQIRGGVKALIKNIIDRAFALVTSTNYGDTDADKLSVAVADFGQGSLAQLWAKGAAKIKDQQRSIILNTEYAAQLYGSSNLALVYASAGENFLQSGRLPRFIDLDVVHYADLPGNGENLGGAVFAPSAIAVAVAPPSLLLASGEGDIVERRIIQDPDSGLSVVYTVAASGSGIKHGEVSLLSGVAVGRNAVVRLVKPSS